MAKPDEKLTDAELQALRNIDPTPRRKDRTGNWRAPMRAPYMPWLVSAYRFSSDKEQFIANGPYIRALLWLHSQFVSMPKSVIGNHRKLPWATKSNLPDTHFGLVESLYDSVQFGVRRIKSRSRKRYDHLFLRYMASAHRHESVDGLVFAETPDEKAERRKYTIANVLKGSKGPFANFFKTDTALGRPPLEVVYKKAGQVILLRVNTYEAQYALGGQEKTSHCISLRGKAGQLHFKEYAKRGPQYMLLFPQTGTMVACQFTGAKEGAHEDHDNKTVKLPLLFSREGLQAESDAAPTTMHEALVSLLQHVASTPQHYKSKEQASEWDIILKLLMRSGYQGNRKIRTILKKAAKQENPFLLESMLDASRSGYCQGEVLAAVTPVLKNNIALVARMAFGLARFALDPHPVSANRYVRRFVLPLLLAHDAESSNRELLLACNQRISEGSVLYKAECLEEKLANEIKLYSALAASKCPVTVRDVAAEIVARYPSRPQVSRALACACWPALSKQAGLPPDVKEDVAAIANSALTARPPADKRPIPPAGFDNG